MYFKVEKSGCGERKGLVQIRYDLYMDETDPGYAVEINPFCSHFCQFDPNVSDEEILFVGELSLDMAWKNWERGSLHLNRNLPVIFSADQERKRACEKRIARIKTTAFSNIKNAWKYRIRG